MNWCHGFLLVAVLLIVAPSSPPPDRRPLRGTRSENGRFHLHIRSGRPHRGETARCRATLFEHVAKEVRAHQVWARPLVNEVAPVYALVRNDGRFVVTLDEFRRGGAAHALVVYNEQGQPVREFDLRELLKNNDWKNVKVEGRAVQWLPSAAFAFVDEPPQFLITLEWGRKIRIDLNTLNVMHAAGTDSDEPVDTTTDIPPEILALLAETTSAPAAETQPSTQPAEDRVQQALQELARLAALSGIEVEELRGVPLPGADTTMQLGPAPSTPGTAGNSIAAGLPVPAANPADPVDYVAWLQEQIFIDGPNAIPHYQAAVDNAVKWTGDDELFGRAMSGDPEALTAPEITAWLDANAEALEHFRAGTDFEFHGMPMETADGTLIGFLLPHLSKMRLLSKAAVIEAKKLEATGEYEAAMGYYLDTLAAGQHASEGPTLIENLVGIAIQALASDRLLDTFARDVDDVIDYVDVAQGLGERYGPARPMAESLQFERAMVLDIVQRGYETNPETGNYRVSENGLEAVSQAIRLVGNGGSPGQVALGFILGRIGFQEMNEQVNEHYDALTEAAGMPYQESQRAFDELHSELEDSALEYRNPLLGMLLPSFGRAAHLATRSDTNRRATLVIANLKAYHQRYGNYPDSLDVLGDDEMVIDPFTDEYFVYRRDGDDFVLYSLSSNGVDDGGIHDRRGQTNDLVYWPRPAKN